MGCEAGYDDRFEEITQIVMAETDAIDDLVDHLKGHSLPVRPDSSHGWCQHCYDDGVVRRLGQEVLNLFDVHWDQLRKEVMG